MSAQLIDGKAFAENLRKKIAADVAALPSKPGLAVVLVGNDPASEVYVRNKGKQTRETGMASFEFHMPATISQDELLNQIESLNLNNDVHGILVQLPLPKHIDENAIINAIDPKKDVDGFHVINSGKLATGQDGFVPCTPLGCWMLLKDQLGDLTGKHAVIIGRSNIVGKPMAALLLKESCTVTIAHSKTKDLPALVKTADIVVAAVGKAEMVKGSWIKPGATIIDVGINRISLPDGKTKLVGDVDFAECKEVAGAITPVPGGVGPMTIACLLANTLKAAKDL
ncbi:MAG: bifunctional methylenetetrahydrofolate dehydrogenase/methenyltetrahydrofolate cyclohydrolase FolD [Rickettsiales bacterium]|nr:bifunctional methylenetetrahydrofolate dehydrogenase/methenyltetrahydrofolate cyclohydrolase FolD [Rickettsiales bacterium]